MEIVKKEFEAIFTIHDQTTLNKIIEFIEQKLNNQKNELAISALGYLEYLQKDQHKVSLGSVNHDQTVKLFIPEFFHKVFQRTPEEIEKSWKEYYQQGIDDFEQKLHQERAKAIDECVAIIENNPCDADGYHFCSQQEAYKSGIQQLKEV